jgi:2,3-bisphosphoglycerate-independent phosphoglycerate mutase
MTAAIKGIEILDDCVGKVVQAVTLRGGVVLITADHGNAEEMINNETGEIDTEHSTYPVPLYIIGNQFQNQARMLPSGILADVGPTILKLLDIPKPDTMTGRVLI